MLWLAFLAPEACLTSAAAERAPSTPQTLLWDGARGCRFGEARKPGPGGLDDSDASSLCDELGPAAASAALEGNYWPGDQGFTADQLRTWEVAERRAQIRPP